MELKEKIFDFVYTLKPVKHASILLILNHFKERGFSE